MICVEVPQEEPVQTTQSAQPAEPASLSAGQANQIKVPCRFTLGSSAPGSSAFRSSALYPACSASAESDTESCTKPGISNIQDISDDAEHLEPIEIAFEDPYFLVVWKPAGLAVHSSGSASKETLCDHVCTYLQSTHAYPIGRLDQEVAGFMVLAKNRLIASMLEIQRSRGKLHKTYLAICHGTWNTSCGHITEPISKTDVFNRYAISSDGLPASSRYKVLDNTEHGSLVEVQIETGRTHQIRLHMKAAGHPIIGDQYYGLQDGVPGCQLYARELSLEHPITKEVLTFHKPVADLPIQWPAFTKLMA